MTPSEQALFEAQLQRLQLHYIREHYQALAAKAAAQQLSPLDYLALLIEGEAAMRESRSIELGISAGDVHFGISDGALVRDRERQANCAFVASRRGFRRIVARADIRPAK